MVAKERLYLSQDGSRIVRADEKGVKTLLACKGGEIPARFHPLVEAFYGKPEPKATESPPAVDAADPAEDLETRVPPDLARRERKRKKT